MPLWNILFRAGGDYGPLLWDTTLDEEATETRDAECFFEKVKPSAVLDGVSFLVCCGELVVTRSERSGHTCLCPLLLLVSFFCRCAAATRLCRELRRSLSCVGLQARRFLSGAGASESLFAARTSASCMWERQLWRRAAERSLG